MWNPFKKSICKTLGCKPLCHEHSVAPITTGTYPPIWAVICERCKEVHLTSKNPNVS